MLTYLRTVLPWSIAVAMATGACASRPLIPPAPIRAHWPDPAFERASQCRGTFALADLRAMLPRARLARWLPAAEAVGLDSTRRCLVITVEDPETGRLTALLLRGVGIPRRAVLLLLAAPSRT